MEKLESRHLIPYLPFSLKVVMEGKKCNVAWMSTKNIAIIRPDGIGEYKRIKWKYAHLNIKPILKPISEILQDQEFLDFLNEHKIEFTSRHIEEMEYRGKFSKSISKNSFGRFNFDLYLFFEKIFELQYDIFGLIDKGLAINKNTLE